MLPERHWRGVSRTAPLRSRYSFNDRGRGPEIRGTYRFDSRGFPASLELTGHDYLKAAVEERLAGPSPAESPEPHHGSSARWRSEFGTRSRDHPPEPGPKPQGDSVSDRGT